MEYPSTKATLHNLPNGLTLILDPDATAPVISVQAWVATGSIHETQHLGSGLSHFLEHMVFKGTRDYSSEGLAQAVQAGGGHWNAYTTFDRTVYYIDGPASSLDVFLKCLTGLVFFPTIPESEFEGEKDVIRREIDMGLDDPDNAAMRLLLSTKYQVDARRHPVIGHRHLFDELQYRDLKEYHRTRYTPDRTHIVISGDFDPTEARALVTSLTADCKIVSGQQPHIQTDPPQVGPRTGESTFDVPNTRLCLSWQTPAIDHEDAPAYELLAAILGRGKASRLYRSLRTRQELAIEISAWTWIGPGQTGIFGISAECAPEKKEELKAAILEEIALLPASALDDELAKAKRQTATSQFRTLTSASGRAADLAANWHEARDLDFTKSYLAQINTVSARDLCRVAARLGPHKLTFTCLEPETYQHVSEVTESTNPVQAITTHTLANGLTIALLPDSRVPLIHFQAAVRAGLPSETPANNGINALFAAVLPKGTQTYSAEEIATTIESLGASISATAGNNAMLVQASGLAIDTSEILEIFADVLKNPTFPQEAIEQEKTSQLASLEEALADPLYRCLSQARRSHYNGQGYGLDTLGTRETVQALGRLDLAAHHSRHFNAANMSLAVTGDFEVEKLIQTLETHLEDLPKGELWKPKESIRNIGETLTLTLPKKQAILAITYPGADVFGTDKHALGFLNEYASDMAGPLFGRIREELGLAYRVGATQFIGYDPGTFTFYLATSPQQIDLAHRELRREIEKIAAQGIPAEAFERVRSTMLSSAALQQQSPASNARSAALDLLFGHPANSHRLLPEIYQALTLEEVEAVAKRILSVASTTSIVLGDADSTAGIE